MRFHGFGRRLLTPTVAALALLFTPLVLFAHARLVRSTPAANSSLSASPSRLTLWFSERPEARFSTIKLLDSANASVSLGTVSILESDPLAVTIALSDRLRGGRYTVVWRTAGADGHPSEGRFSFRVASVPDTVTPASVTVPAVPDTLRVGKPVSNAVVEVAPVATFSTAMRWAELVAIITMIGAIVFRLAVLPRAAWSVSLETDAAERARRLGQSALLLFIVTTATRVAAQSSLVPGTTGGPMSGIATVMRDTRWGHGWSIGAIGALIVLIGLVIARTKNSGWTIAGIGVAGVGLSEALTGHSGVSRQVPLAVGADVVHFSAAGAWLGGLVALLLSGFPSLRAVEEAERSRAGSRLVRAYHDLAIVCVGLVIASALVAATLRLDSISALVTTTYGQVLFRKVVFVTFVLLFGVYHYRRVVRVAWDSDTAFRFQRSAIAELIVAAIVLAFTAILVTTPISE